MKLNMTNSRNASSRRGFTLLEILIVIVLIAIISSFAIPNYQKSIEVAYEKEAINGMVQIIQARKIYLATHAGNDMPVPLADMDAINSVLKTHLSSDKLTFQCLAGFAIVGGTSADYALAECLAVSPYGWDLHMGWGDPAWNDDIHCGESGPCPTCANSHNGCSAN